MPTLNKRLFARLLLLTVLLGAGLFGLHRLQADRITQALLWQAERAAEQDKLDLASHYLSRYMEFRPDDIDAAVRLCDLLEKRGKKDSQGLMFLVEKILRKDPENEAIRRKAVGICLRLKRYSDAIIHAEELLKQFPNDGGVWEQIAAARMNQNQNDEARAAYEKAIAVSPNRVQTYGFLAELLVRQFSDARAAKAVLDRMVAANGSDGEAYLIRARFFMNQSQMEPAKVDLDRLLLLDPENADGMLLLADVLQSKGDIRSVRNVLTEASMLYHRDVRLYRALSWLELSAGNRPAAIACLERGTQELPNHADLLTPLADLLVQDGELDKVDVIIRKLDSRKVAISQVKYLKARVQMARSQWAIATEALNQLRADAVTLPGLAIQVNLLLAECYRQQANREAEMQALQRVFSVDANNLSARISLGTIALNAGRFEDAVKEYGLVVRSPYAPMTARVLHALLRIGKARGTNASPEEWDEIAENIATLCKKYPQSAEPVLAMADLLVARKRLDEASQYLRAECAAKSRDARLWAKLAMVRERQLGSQAALEVLDEAQAMLADQVELRLARAQVWAKSLSPRKLTLLKSLETGLEEFSEGDQIRLLYGLADVYAGMQEGPAVKRVYETIASRYPRDLPIRAALMDLAVDAKDSAAAKQLLTEVANLEKDTPRTLKLMQASQKLGEAKPGDQQPLQEARELVQSMLKQYPGRTDAMVMLARICEAEDDYANARKLYAQAVNMERSDLRHVKSQLKFLWRTNQDVLTQKLLTEMVSDPRITGDQFRALVGAALVGLNQGQFLKGTKTIRPLIGEDAASLVWLGDLYWAKGQFDDAMQSYDAAMAASPSHADAYVHRVCRLAEKGQLNDVPAIMAKAKSALAEPAYFLLCAQTMDLVKAHTGKNWQPTFSNPEERRSMAQALLTYYLTQSQRKEAMALLAGMVDAKDVRPQDRTWASRNLALLQAVDGSSDDRRKALAMMQKQTETGTITLEDQRSQVAILALASRHLDNADRKLVLQDAISMLEKIADNPAVSTTKDRYHLAQLYRLSGNRAAYRKTLTVLLEQDATNRAYRLALVEDLLADNKLEEALPHVQKLQANFGGDYRAVGLVAKYHQLMGSPERVLAMMDAYIRDVEPGSNEASLRVRQAAELLDSLARTTPAGQEPSSRILAASAIDKYAAGLRLNPDGLVPLVSLLAYDGQPNRAFDLINRLKPQLSNRLLTSAGLSLLRSGQANDRQFQTVKDWLDTAVAQQPDSTMLQLTMAEYHALKQDYAAAEKLYQAVLTKDPNNVMALNNLAWILAPKPDTTARALQYVQKAIDLTGHTGELLDTRARVLIASGKYDRAVEDLTEALNQSETSLRYFHLAVARLKQSQPAAATTAFRKAKFHGLNPQEVHPSDLPAFKVLSAELGS
ncbi:tetratricopeptide repeat protein [Tuwongella immobilis]|uniref:Uncharacterized protein n=1 Tax=Tuwongella immobilis TaxID=692036 RepID=A0A6C2YIW3_9BACT|nr:tetratricopeptide repeat protein [Tuwongella immobilis]VIP01347.1 tetratricopeptide tpr_1 repeat-containing protein : Uncharacterized protein OS=Singulisphaera acidiphila (strain ATCC BAA-1392 / DSM 18658 / VKM B-2454 / MOB10) GN=Sinac_2466 PE=4 SV=1: TPR_11: TPR_2: TPR_2 [Tuwongella immobilis]VTR98134.1 tetratricopeptide tpr_1 repeat-containing protein : Uncharacterized protein OS=Singulisphaera acidiphila (strain ATCC BAA-1392 / DSM 18658 / VKM B-2454 / MOB10) GN=Sinac_2466 PE=4 SV=1: TPR_11